MKNKPVAKRQFTRENEDALVDSSQAIIVELTENAATSVAMNLNLEVGDPISRAVHTYLGEATTAFFKMNKCFENIGDRKWTVTDTKHVRRYYFSIISLVTSAERLILILENEEKEPENDRPK